MKNIIILLFICTQFYVKASTDSVLRKGFSLNDKISARIDVNFMNVTGRTGFRGVGMNGSAELGYRLNDNLTIGVYGGHATDISTKERYFQIEDKVYDLTTSKLTFFGISGGYKVWSEGRFNITPDLRLGLGYFQVNEIFNTLNNEFKLKRSLIMITPRVNFGFLITKNAELGLNFSYLIPFSVNGDINQYDLGNISTGVFGKIYF